jgi:hypothetical protein
VSFKTDVLLLVLLNRINKRLDEIHDEAIRGFRSLAKSVGQRTRVDRLKSAASAAKSAALISWAATVKESQIVRSSKETLDN